MQDLKQENARLRREITRLISKIQKLEADLKEARKVYLTQEIIEK